MIKCTYSMISRSGGREVNEDSCSAGQHKGRLIALLADGLGGQGDGEIASRVAVETAEPLLQQGMLMSARRMKDAFCQANTAVLEKRQAMGNKMMTTMAAVTVCGPRVSIAHVGDSRVYWFRGGEVLFQTLDHSLCQLMVLSGEIKPEEIRGHASRNLLLRALGENENLQVDTRAGWLRRGDRLLLCSDGFWDLIDEREMLAAGGISAKDWLDNMCALVASRQELNSDNYTAIAIQAE